MVLPLVGNLMVVQPMVVINKIAVLELVMEAMVVCQVVMTVLLVVIKEALQMVQVELLRMVGLVKVVTGEDQRQQAALDLYLLDQSKYKI
jgi:hypothetical protein